MNLDRLRYFCVLAKTQHLRQAAELLTISPPALSKAIKLLEEETGLRLCIAHGRGLQITDEGRRLALQADSLIEQIESLPKKTKLNQESVPLRVGTFEVFSTYFVSRLLNQFEDEAPALEFLELVPGQMEEAIVKQKVDLGITYIPIPKSGVEHILVSQTQMGIFGRKDFPYSLKTFQDIPFVVPITPIEGSPTKVQGLDGWPDHQILRNSLYKMTMMESALELCRRGRAVAYLPSFVVQIHNESVLEKYKLVEFPLPSKMKKQSQPIYLVKRIGQIETVSIRKVAKALRLLRS